MGCACISSLIIAYLFTFDLRFNSVTEPLVPLVLSLSLNSE